MDIVEKALNELDLKVESEYIYPPNRPAFILAQKLRSIFPADVEWSQIEPYSTEFYKQADKRGLMDDRDGTIEPYEFDCMLVDAMGRVKFPEGKVLQAIIERAKVASLPPSVESLPDDGTKLIASVCYKLHAESGGKPFFLSQKTAGEIIGKSQPAGYRKLLYLRSIGMIVLKEKGFTGKASVYDFIEQQASFPKRSL